ncbi:MAG TPA: hypothetical protein VLF21_00575 [Candidatus Saccharimonadales bacterium]|nr:hypothetical protein [Candidatus Saccharimonadales bacterium]
MLKRAMGLFRGRGNSYPEAKERYEAASGHPHNDRETGEFEAVSWMVSSGDNPGLALKRFEKESQRPDSDLEDRLYNRTRDHLRRWGGPLAALGATRSRV